MDDGHRDPAQDAFARAKAEREATEAARRRAEELKALQQEYEDSQPKTDYEELRVALVAAAVKAVDKLADLMDHADSMAVQRDAAKAILQHGVAMAKGTDTNDSIGDILRRAGTKEPAAPIEDLDAP